MTFRRLPLRLLPLGALIAACAVAPASAAPDCAGLATLALPATRVDGAAPQPAGTFTPPDGSAAQANLPAFCRVTLTLTPTPVSDIKVEVWLPAEGWNGRLLGVGNGGLAGVISYGAMAPGLRQGYATVSTDTGHTERDNSWLPVMERQVDYGSRSTHLMTVTAKAVIERFYGSAPRRSYFNGCSTGGGQAFGEMQDFPEDYDGVVAGAPQNFATHSRAHVLWQWLAANRDPAARLSRPTLELINRAVLHQCGTEGERADGFLANPQACRFDPGRLACQPGQDTAQCLTPPQVQAVRDIYQGPLQPRTGRLIMPGPMPGSEAMGGPGRPGWQQAGVDGGPPFSTPVLFFRLALFRDPDFDLRNFDFDKHLNEADRIYGPVLSHIRTDLSAFVRRGGRALLWHGFGDPLISPRNTINYYDTVRAELGEGARDALQLFLVPGMGHCGGGPGPTTIDFVAALDRWVETGARPEVLPAAHVVNGTPAYSRPVCAYPGVARETGTGDRREASAWRCVPEPYEADGNWYREAGTFGQD